MAFIKTLLIWLRRLLLLVWCLVLAIGVTKFYMDNTAATNVVLWGAQFTDVAVSRIIFVALGLGMSVTFLLLVPWVLWLRTKLIKARYQLAKAQNSLQTLNIKP
ncbi:MAG: hypothetical protein U5M23_14505 [Marinagarivorans sp.]|nr:hypothetical protein [Marinagarivorans sp.]